MEKQFDEVDLPSDANDEKKKEKGAFKPEELASSTAGMCRLAERLSNYEASEDDILTESHYMIDQKLDDAASHTLENQDKTIRLLSITDEEELKEKAALTSEELASSTADMYGLAESLSNCEISEDDDLPEALYMIDQKLNDIPRERKSAYLEAQQKCPDLVDDKHKEAFLWAEHLDAKLAAERLGTYWQKRLELFGPVKCFLPMTLQGAMKDDIGALSTVGSYILPMKDVSGRAIIYRHTPDLSRCEHESMMRAFWYSMHTLIEDTEVQKRGVVTLIFPHGGAWSLLDLNLQRYIHTAYQIEQTFPLRIRAQHFIQPGFEVHQVIRFAKACSGKELRQRTQVHVGSVKDVQEGLGRFGLSSKLLPSEIGGAVIIDQNSWISSRVRLEAQRAGPRPGSTLETTAQDAVPSSSIIPCPVLTSETASKKQGYKGDPRMNRALQAKLDDPSITSKEALLLGGFQFPISKRGEKKKPDYFTFDDAGVSLQQRKNQLARRLRSVREMKGADSARLSDE